MAQPLTGQAQHQWEGSLGYTETVLWEGRSNAGSNTVYHTVPIKASNGLFLD
jgi:hypothetical protein